jgi:hypothetical protein
MQVVRMVSRIGVMVTKSVPSSSLTRCGFVVRHHATTPSHTDDPAVFVTKTASVDTAAKNSMNVSSPANAPRGALDAYELGEDEVPDDLEEMFIDGPAGVEWGGPTRGGQRPEPTRYGDWERKGRASDF